MTGVPWLVPTPRPGGITGETRRALGPLATLVEDPRVNDLFVLLGVHAGATQLGLEDEVSLQARYASLGGVVEGVSEEGDLLCVEAHHTLDRGLWALDPLVLSARSCALNPIPPSREG